MRRAGDPAGVDLDFVVVDVTTRKLRHFVVVADELDFGRAAARLAVAQHTVSKQVDELEEALGIPLLSRRDAALELTHGTRGSEPA